MKDPIEKFPAGEIAVFIATTLLAAYLRASDRSQGENSSLALKKIVKSAKTIPFFGF